ATRSPSVIGANPRTEAGWQSHDMRSFVTLERTSKLHRLGGHAIVGPSGSGKSTLLSILGCLDQPSTGRYLLGHQRVAALSRNRLGDLRNPRIGFVFQNFSLLPRLTVLENVGLPLFYRREQLRHPAARSRAALEQVGLGARMHHMPTQASGAHTPAPGKKHPICVFP